jgi:hypothetical protein
MSGGPCGEDEDDGEDIITIADVAAVLGELHGLYHNLRARVARPEAAASLAELRADVAVTMALGQVDAPGDELTSDGDQGGDQP